MTTPLVLLIEDDLSDAELAKAALARLSFKVEVVHVRTGTEGISALSTALHRAAPPSAALVLLDLALPLADGLEVLAQIKSDSLLRLVPVVVFSGTENPRKVRAAFEQNVSAFLVKAGDIDQFVTRVCSVAETFLLHTASPLAAL